MYLVYGLLVRFFYFSISELVWACMLADTMVTANDYRTVYNVSCVPAVCL